MRHAGVEHLALTTALCDWNGHDAKGKKTASP